MRNNRKAEIIVRNRKIMVAVILLITVIFGALLFTNIASANSCRPVYTYYTSYEIQSGDSLWTIADQFMGPDYTDKQDFINNIKRINHLGDDNITEGKFIVIEYSSYEQI